MTKNVLEPQRLDMISETKALLEGLKTETIRLAEILARLDPRAASRCSKENPADPPTAIVGPRNVGKTTLLDWMAQQAKLRQIEVIRQPAIPIQLDNPLMTEQFAKFFGYGKPPLQSIAQSLIEKLGADENTTLNTALSCEKALRPIVSKQPLLLLLDEACLYTLDLLDALLPASHTLISEGLSLAVVFAGLPGMDVNLDKAGADAPPVNKIYINTLSNEATIAILKFPFAQSDITINSEALKIIASHTDNYARLVLGAREIIWQAAVRTKTKIVNRQLVQQFEQSLRSRRSSFYSEAYYLIRREVVPHACRVIEIIEANGGKIKTATLINALARSDPSISLEASQTICQYLQNEGFIWTIDGETAPCMPALFEEFKERACWVSAQA